MQKAGFLIKRLISRNDVLMNVFRSFHRKMTGSIRLEMRPASSYYMYYECEIQHFQEMRFEGAEKNATHKVVGLAQKMRL